MRDEVKWWIRFGILSTAVAAMMINCERRGEDANPNMVTCVLKPAEYDGRSVWIPGARVVDRSEGEVLLSVGSITLRGTGRTAGLKLHDELWFSGTFRAPDSFEIDATRPKPGEPWVLYGVSGAVLLAILWAASRRFQLRSAPIEAGR